MVVLAITFLYFLFPFPVILDYHKQTKFLHILIYSRIAIVVSFSFNFHDALAKYAGLTWRVNQSGNYSADDTRMTKRGISGLATTTFIHNIILIH